MVPSYTYKTAMCKRKLLEYSLAFWSTEQECQFHISLKKQNQPFLSSLLPYSLLSPQAPMTSEASAFFFLKNCLTSWTLRASVFWCFSTPEALEPYWCFLLLKRMITWLQELLQFRGSHRHCPFLSRRMKAGQHLPIEGAKGLSSLHVSLLNR